MDANSSENFGAKALFPLKKRGRPKLRDKNHRNLKNIRRVWGRSNLAQLYYEKKITTEQFNAGETFLWILHEVRKDIPLPYIAKNSYQERVQGIIEDINLKNEARRKKIWKWWRDSMFVLSAAGGTIKNLVEDFIRNDGSSHVLLEVELQLIRRGLDHLVYLYRR